MAGGGQAEEGSAATRRAATLPYGEEHFEGSQAQAEAHVSGDASAEGGSRRERACLCGMLGVQKELVS